MKTTLSLVPLLLALLTGCVASKRHDPKAIDLLRPENFYTYLSESGLNNDPRGVFTWTNGLLRISGEEWGYIITKEEFSNYRLVTEFKWGDQTWPPREENARDSGVLVHVVGRDHVWPKSIEAQIIEGGTGDILVVSGATLTVDGETKGPRTARFDRPGRNPWDDVKGFRGPNEIEKPHGQWNRMEVICDGDRIAVIVNGIQTLEGTNASPTAGKILLQSESAEIFFRRVDLHPLSQ